MTDADTAAGDWVAVGKTGQNTKSKKNKSKKPQAAKTPTATVNGTAPSGSHNVTSKDQIQQAFKALRAAISDREKALLAQQNLNLNLDISHVLALINNLGSGSEPAPATKKPAAQQQSPVPKAVSPVEVIKHATSQSSISSSVGADSGVNLSPTHKEEKKPVAAGKPKTAEPSVKVTNGGFQVAGGELTSEQLAEFQRSLQQQLQAHGIDESVLTGLSGGDMPVRRPRKPQENNNNNKRGGHAGRGAHSRPQISILKT